MIVRSKAPLRISFCGGGTDVPPYPEEHGGLVLSTTINKYAYASLMEIDDNALQVTSLDYDVVARYNMDQLLYNGELDLVKAVVRHMHAPSEGLHLFIHSDAPPGSGLGSSSTMVVALLGAFRHYLHRQLSDYEIAEMAWYIERVELGIKGGMQDQYAATFGGFNLIEFLGDEVVVNPLRVEPDTLNELEYHLLLCYTGGTRLSANIIERQVGAYERREADVLEALHGLKALTIEMKNVLLQGRLDDFGNLLHEAWLSKKKLATGVTNDRIDELYELARAQGAMGGKILGAGGGGYLLLYVPFARRHLVAQALERIGGRMVGFAFDACGLQTWDTRRAMYFNAKRA